LEHSNKKDKGRGSDASSFPECKISLNQWKQMLLVLGICLLCF
jgi:hypothetical protein